VQIDNAPVACAQAQLWLGQRGGAIVPRDFAYMTVSDGVGVGVVVDGQVLRGHAFTAGEFGHIPLALDGPRCLCGARGCLEAYTSNLGHAVALPRPRAVARRARAPSCTRAG
jgi:predicted NBD/HSP70 family sugar kinase